MKRLASLIALVACLQCYLLAQEVFEVKRPEVSFIPANVYTTTVQVTANGRSDSAMAAAIKQYIIYPDSFKAYELQAMDVVSFEIGAGGTGSIGRFAHQQPLLYGIDSLSAKAIVAGVQKWQKTAAPGKPEMLSTRFIVTITYGITDTITGTWWRNCSSRNDAVVNTSKQLRTGAIKYSPENYNDAGLTYNLALNYLYDIHLRNYCNYLKQHLQYLKVVRGSNFTNPEIENYLSDCKAAEGTKN